MRQIDQLHQVTDPTPPTTFNPVKPSIRERLITDAPLMSSDDVEVKAVPKQTIPQDEKKAVYDYMREVGGKYGQNLHKCPIRI